MTLIDFTIDPLAEKQTAPRLAVVGAGRLGLWGRPPLARLPDWKARGLTTVLTLLSLREGAPRIGDAVLAAGLAWRWFEQANGDKLPAPRCYELLELLQSINTELDGGSWVLIHCAAGQHRTGMAAYALLRLRGLSPGEALALIAQMRLVTRQGVGAGRLAWVETWLAGFSCYT